MRALLCILITVSMAQAQDIKETYGKTNSQILAMGYDKWYDYYTSKAGEMEARFTFWLTNITSSDVSINSVRTSCAPATRPARPHCA